VFVLNFLFPRLCINCRAEGEYLCKSCKKSLTPHPEICPYCHRFSEDYKTCLNCRTDRSHHLEWLIVAFSYQDLVKKLILQLKYYHKSDVADFLTERLALAISTNKSLPSRFKISYVPSHRFRHYCVKGYNQSKVLAQRLSNKTGLPRVYIARKTRSTHTQAGLNRVQRLTNLENAFQMDARKIRESDTILIIDDVTTTWSTINELAKTIKSQFPKVKIRWAVLARNTK